MEQNNGIMGMDALLEKLPREYQNWFCFGHILKFEYKEIFDYENWDTRYNAELILSNDSETYKIRLLLKHISGEFTIRVTEDIVGLNIRNLTGSGLESCNRFISMILKATLFPFIVKKLKQSCWNIHNRYRQ